MRAPEHFLKLTYLNYLEMDQWKARAAVLFYKSVAVPVGKTKLSNCTKTNASDCKYLRLKFKLKSEKVLIVITMSLPQ